MNADTTERLVACSLVRTRFRGRAELERAAKRDPIALARLEVRLGLAPESAIRDAEDEEIEHHLRECVAIGLSHAARLLALSRRERRGWAARDRLARGYPVLREIWERAEELRQERRERRSGDELARRRPGNVARRVAVRRAEELYLFARFRGATHGHEWGVQVVERGEEGASSSTDQVHPQEVGLPAAYARKGYWVTQSEHTIRVSTEILCLDREWLRDQAGQGLLYLRHDLRVVQGRGTALRVERLGPRGGWS
jgi:hypothetical protein